MQNRASQYRPSAEGRQVVLSVNQRIFIGLLFYIAFSFVFKAEAVTEQVNKTHDAYAIYGYDLNDNNIKYLNEAIKYSAYNYNFAADKDIYLARQFVRPLDFEAKAYQNLGILALKRQQPQQAFLFFQQAARLAPGDHDAHAFWLEAFCQQIGIRDTEALLVHNYETQPTNPENVYMLGLLYQKQGRLDAAIPFFQAFLDLAPNGLLAQSAQNTLIDLQLARQALVKSPYSQIR